MKIKDQKYYSVERIDLLQIVPNLYGSILDVGCGAGATMAYLTEQGIKDVTGIEYVESACQEARRKGLNVLRADLEKDNIDFNNKRFDFILFADILEHLYDPWTALKKFKDHLKDDGMILISIPNMKHYRILKKLIFRDEWAYQEFGILDFTHIRFFTKKEAIKLINDAGFKIETFEYKTRKNKLFKFISFLNKDFAMTLWPEQFLIAARKDSSK